MRSDLDSNIARGLQIATALQYGAALLAISADQTLSSGMPYLLGYDPANTTRALTLYTPTAPMVVHRILHYGTGTGQLTIKSPAAATLATLDPGSIAEVVYVNATVGWLVFVDGGASAIRGNAAKSMLSLYVPLLSVANTNVIAAKVPFAFTLVSVGFRTKIPVTTAAKLATLTAQINATPCTGGVISLTSANCTPTNTLVAGTAITALNTGAAGDNVGVLASAVTAFSEGDGYVEFQVTNLT